MLRIQSFLKLAHCSRVPPNAFQTKDKAAMETPRSQKQNASLPKSMPAGAVMGVNPLTEENLRFRAYMLFRERERTGTPGDALSDWCRAQRELRPAALNAEQTRRA
jgi:hypothetical protein